MYNGPALGNSKGRGGLNLENAGISWKKYWLMIYIMIMSFSGSRKRPLTLRRALNDIWSYVNVGHCWSKNGRGLANVCTLKQSWANVRKVFHLANIEYVLAKVYLPVFDQIKANLH